MFGQPSRRAACDRCRSQKVKCLPTNDDTRAACQRCQRSETQCTQTSIGRIGRPPNYNKREQKIAHRRFRSGSSSGLLDSSAQPTGPGGLTDSAAEGQDESQSRDVDGMGFSPGLGVDFDSSGEYIEGPYSSSGTTALSLQLSTTSEKQNPFDFLSGNIAMDDNFFSFDSMGNSEEMNSMALHDPSAMYSQFTFLQGLDDTYAEGQKAKPTTVPTVQASRMDPAKITTRQDVKSSMQNLLSLNATLYDLMDETARVEKEHHLLQTQDNHIDKILRATQTFLDVVGSFVPGHSGHRTFVTKTARVAASSTPEKRQDESRTQIPRAPDIHVFLIVVSCYTLIMRVYGNLIDFIHEKVQCDGTAAQTCTDLNLPALQVGVTTIQNDVSLQAVILVRIGMSKIRRINTLMDSILSHVEHADTCEAVPSLGIDNELSLGRRSMCTKPVRREGLSFGGGDQRAKVEYMKGILDAAIKREDCESALSGQSGIGSLERALAALENLL